MINRFADYLRGIGKSENTVQNYCEKIRLYYKWCQDSFGSEPKQLYHANVLDYVKLYLDYDLNEEFLPQFTKNAEFIMGLMNLMPAK